MPYMRWQATVTRANGDVVPNAQVDVYREQGGARQALKADYDGLSGKNNPFQADSNGFAFFHAPAGHYRIVATAEGFSREWRHVPLGTAQAFDIDALSGDVFNTLTFNVQVDELADRDAYDSEDVGFVVLVSDTGDGRAAIYTLISSGSPGTWSGPAYLTVTGPIFNVKNFGAVGDDVTDDLGAFNDARDAAISAGGGLIKVPAGGKYYLSGLFEIEVAGEQHIVLDGDGPEVSTIRFGGATGGGVKFNSTTVVANRKPYFQISNISVVTSKKNNGIGVDAQWADAAIISRPFFMFNVHVKPDVSMASDDGDGGYGYWSKTIYANNARLGTVLSCWLCGERDVSPVTSALIHIEGESTDFRVLATKGIEATYGFLIEGTTEGVVVDAGCSFVYVNNGIYDNNDGSEPQIVIANSHINALERCIRINKAAQWTIHDMLLYASAIGSPDPDWIGIAIEDSAVKWGQIHHITIAKEAGRAGANEVGIHVVAGDEISIDHINIFSPDANAMAFGVVVEDAATNIDVKGVRTSIVTTPLVLGTGSGCQYESWGSSGPTRIGNGDQVLTFAGGLSAALRLRDIGAAANSQYAELKMDGGVMTLRLLNDDFSTKHTALSVAANGVISLSNALAIAAAGADLLTLYSSGQPWQMLVGTSAGLDYRFGRSGGDGLLYVFGNQSGFNGLVLDGANGQFAKFLGANPSNGKTNASLKVNDGSLTTLRQVSVGASDSGGSGYRLLRVPN